MPIRKNTLREDAVAGVVLGVQSVPDGLATGLLAGVSPLSGLYAYMVGTFTGALVASSSFMAIQGTGAMAMIVADVPAVHNAANPASALFTLSVLTGVVMLAAGLLKLGSILRFVSNAVMVGFINAVGVNIILGQLANFTGYDAQGSNRIARAFDTLVNPALLDPATLAVGFATIALILLLERTKLGALGLVVAVIVTSGGAAALGWGVATLDSLGVVLGSLPRPELPVLALVPALMVPALSLAFVGLVQGASISANYPNPDGNYPDVSRDFAGQGAANVAAGLLQGMPVGGSVSASALNKEAGARSRQSLVIAGLVMAVVVVAFGTVVGYVAMPALAGLLMLIGFRTIKPPDLISVWKTGLVQKAVLLVTFLLTMIVPLQYAVLIGVGLSVILHTVRQSNQITLRRWTLEPDGDVLEVDPPTTLPANEVVVLQPYGSLFFAAAPVFEALLPAVSAASRNSVVILRLRGRSDLGTTFMDVLLRYAQSVVAAGSKLVVVSTNERIDEQLALTGIAAVIGPENMLQGTERLGATVRSAYDDATAWVEAGRA
ncbi:MAG TPA: SulP family inorganic anion transporter [Candidatus Limnocylindrales bacterium]|nr:SulP family inorganic anion transporter [Candidatus Limnocylindrales bacterium]